ncbi:MAG: tRNA (adenosine(37)-N6)-dimethylallyltransferase MiaA [Faecalibacterium sp.]|nr:tRNA (adenosine(37)-N6)-dimethylallyltransferase MiaA [Faecalibacterium sp.]
MVAVVGPTASGKSSLAIALAKQFDGEVISADSMQIYCGLDVGTAKVTAQEADGVVHHGLDIRTPEQLFSVADFVSYAQTVEQQLFQKGKLPVICGGTGLYVQSFLDGLQFAQEKAAPSMRAALAAELQQRGAQAMYDELYAVDPEAALSTHPNNTVRVLRALEHYRATGQTLSEQKALSIPPEKPYNSLILGLQFADRSVLYRRIDLRVDIMMEQGLLQEAEMVYRNRELYQTAAQAIGYKEFFPYFEGTAPLADCIDKLKQASRNYAKRQMTWFRRMPQIQWLDAQAADVQQQAIAVVNDFLQAR